MFKFNIVFKILLKTYVFLVSLARDLKFYKVLIAWFKTPLCNKIEKHTRIILNKTSTNIKNCCFVF